MAIPWLALLLIGGLISKIPTWRAKNEERKRQAQLEHEFNKIKQQRISSNDDDIFDYDDYDAYFEKQIYREKVIARDKGKCRICGAIGEHVHHIKPRSKGGTNDLDNLILLCTKCHADKHPDNKKLIIASEIKFRYGRIENIKRVRLKKQTARNEYLCYICRKTINPYDEYYYGRKTSYSAPQYGFRYPTLESSASVHICTTCAIENRQKLNLTF